MKFKYLDKIIKETKKQPETTKADIEWAEFDDFMSNKSNSRNKKDYVKNSIRRIPVDTYKLKQCTGEKLKFKSHMDGGIQLSNGIIIEDYHERD